MARRKAPHIPDALLDHLLAGADPKSAFDASGLLDDLKKALAERALNAEMDHHLAGDEVGNSRNGYGRKTVMTCPLNLLSVLYVGRRRGLWDDHLRRRRHRRPRHGRRSGMRTRSWRRAGLSVLELARELGSVAEACRQRGMDKTSFYEWKRRFQTQGFEGLKDLPPIHKSHPQTTPPETAARIRELALTHPAYGCNRHEALLALEGIRVSSITIQKILNDSGLGTRLERWLALEARNAEQAIAISPEQAAFLEKLNPCFRERHVESSAPGELLSADTFFVSSLKGVGKVYLHAVVDTFGSYAFGFLHVSKQPEAAVAVLHNDVLPFYRNLDLPVGAILTDNGREFCGTDRHPYELYLDLNGIEHRRTKVRSPKTNGFVERFNGTVFDEFFRVKMRETLYDSVEALQADLDQWLIHYNTQRPHLGYRNMGRRPIETIMSFVSQEG